MSQDKPVLSREQIKDWRSWAQDGCNMEFGDILRDKFIQLCDLALSALETPVMAGPKGMQKAYDKGFADGQEKTWKAALANTSARPDSISDPTEQPRPTEASPVSALERQGSGKWVPLEPTKEMMNAGYRQYCTVDKRGYSAWQDHLAVYRAMLAAAPQEQDAQTRDGK